MDKPIIFSAPMVRAIIAGQKTQTRRILKETVPPPPAMDAIHPSNKAKHPAPYFDSYCGARKTEQNPRGMSDRWCWWTRDDRQCLPTVKVRWVPGDRLWVRETFGLVWPDHCDDGRIYDDPAYPYDGRPIRNEECTVEYRADLPRGCTDKPGRWPADEEGGARWKPSIFMPRWASRITLEVTGVRVERLQDIVYEDALAEGVGDYTKSLPDDRPDETSEACARRLKWPQRAYADLWDRINGAGSWDANPWVVAIEFQRVKP